MSINFLSNLVSMFNLHLKSIEKMIFFILFIPKLRVLIDYLGNFESVLNFYVKNIVLFIASDSIYFTFIFTSAFIVLDLR